MVNLKRLVMLALLLRFRLSDACMMQRILYESYGHETTTDAI